MYPKVSSLPSCVLQRQRGSEMDGLGIGTGNLGIDPGSKCQVDRGV